MRPILRYTGTIAVTAVAALFVAAYVFDPPADAQPAPQVVPQPSQTTNTGAVPAPTVQQVDKGAASSSAPGSDATPGPQPATGSAAPAAPPAAEAGSGAGSAAPAAPRMPSCCVASVVLEGVFR